MTVVINKGFMDQYSLLHFCTGVIAFFFKVPFWYWFVFHLAFEYLENLPQLAEYIDKNIPIWPGGKKSPDTLINSTGDQIFAMLGWYVAYYLDIKLN